MAEELDTALGLEAAAATVGGNGGRGWWWVGAGGSIFHRMVEKFV
jgi:hypothetical protein